MAIQSKIHIKHIFHGAPDQSIGYALYPEKNLLVLKVEQLDSYLVQWFLQKTLPEIVDQSNSLKELGYSSKDLLDIEIEVILADKIRLSLQLIESDFDFNKTTVLISATD